MQSGHRIQDQSLRACHSPGCRDCFREGHVTWARLVILPSRDFSNVAGKDPVSWDHESTRKLRAFRGTFPLNVEKLSENLVREHWERGRGGRRGTGGGRPEDGEEGEFEVACIPWISWLHETINAFHAYSQTSWPIQTTQINWFGGDKCN